MKNWNPPQGYIEKKYNYTYKLTFKYDRRYYYYGVHSTNKKPEIDEYYGSGTNVKLFKKLYGKDCFDKEILEFFETKKESLLAEDKLVPVELLSDKFCLNKIQGGGTFDTTGMVMDENFRKVISERFKGKKRTAESIQKGYETKVKHGTLKASEETKKKIGEVKKGKICVVKGEVVKIISQSDLNEYISNGWKRGLSDVRNKKVAKAKMGDKNPMYGKHWSEESKRKMVETKIKNGTNLHSERTKAILAEKNREKAKNPEFLKKLSESLKGVNTWSKGRNRINKDGVTKSVKKEELQEYLDNGWKLGQGYKVRNGR